MLRVEKLGLRTAYMINICKGQLGVIEVDTNLLTYPQLYTKPAGFIGKYN